MNILTLQLGHHASALLARDGIVVGAVSQERFDGVKGSAQFPKDAINWLLAQGGIASGQIDFVTFCGAPDPAGFKELEIAPDKIKTVDHALCHAFAPLAFFDHLEGDWLIVTADSAASTVNVWDGVELKRIAESPVSLGQLYGAVTEHLGMRAGMDEGKVMGLASYVKKDDYRAVYELLFQDMFTFEGEAPLILKTRVPEIAAYLKEKAVGVRFDHLAGAVQHCLEETITAWIARAIELTGITQIMTSGGVFTNVKLNKIIRERSEVTATRFMPSCGNETNVFGAAYAACADLKPVQTLYLGQAYSDDVIEKFLTAHPAKDRFTLTHHDNIEETVAAMLAEHKIVARFSGKAEFGARSLGNRAILAHPADRELFAEINDQIKARDFWMPFAPTILDVEAGNYLKEGGIAPHMIDSFDTTETGRRALCAAMHPSDKTVRPQILTREENPAFYKLVEAFKAKTGIGAVMNTSFNLHGAPLATTPDQAMDTMLKSGLRYMSMGGWLVEKKE